MDEIFFAFDLDGTVTREETLPYLAGELGLREEMKQLTELTLGGWLDFKESFRLRCGILQAIPEERLRELMAAVPLDEEIAGFIRSHAGSCAIVTGNLRSWAEPLVTKLGCRLLASEGERRADGSVRIREVLDKGEALRRLRQQGKQPLAAIGESFNDLPMLREADIAIAYGGVHPPVRQAAELADYVVRDSGELCGLLRRLEGVEGFGGENTGGQGVCG